MFSPQRVALAFAAAAVSVAWFVQAQAGTEPTDDQPPSESPPPDPQPASDDPDALTHEESLALDAAFIAEQNGISVEEALSRLQHEERFGQLAADLSEKFPETFSGAWVVNEPAY